MLCHTVMRTTCARLVASTFDDGLPVAPARCRLIGVIVGVIVGVFVAVAVGEAVGVFAGVFIGVDVVV